MTRVTDIQTIKKATDEEYLKKILDTGRFWQSPSEVYSWYKMKKAISQFLISEIKRIEGVKKDNNEKIKILDVGCGLGADISMLNLLVDKKNVEFQGMDLSSVAVDAAQKLALARGDTNCTFFKGNAEILIYPNILI